MLPRRAVFTLDADTPVPAARELLAASGHSRAPVVRHGSLDETIGVVNLRDLVRADPATLTELARPPLLLPDSLYAVEALRRFKTDRQQFALVVNEHGAVDGMPGTFPVHDLPDLGVHLHNPPRGDYVTFAGLVILLLGHLPTQPGDTASFDAWTAEVTAVDRHAITAVRLRPHQPGTAAGPLA
jgi:putative hemolysin